MRAPTIIALAALLLAGCGQKGPLYLPADRDGGNAAMVSDKESNEMSDDTHDRAGDTPPANAAPDDES